MQINLAQATGMDYQEAGKLLVAKNWNYAAALSHIKEGERKDHMAYELMAQFPQLEFE